MIIDAHTHILIYNNNAESLDEVYKNLILTMKENGVDYAIIIPDNLENQTSDADLTKLRQLIKDNNKMFLLGSPQIIQRGSTEINTYRQLLKDGIIKGIKLFPGHDPYNPTDERCHPYYQLLQELDYPLVIHTGEVSSNPKISNPSIYNDPKYIVEVAKQYPKLKVIISHYYWPKLDYCYETTKNTQNIYFELAACGDEEVIEACGGIDKMRKVLKTTISDRPDKVIFGTDWPMCDSKTKSGFAHHIELVKSLDLSKETEELIFSQNAIRIYHLPI